MLSRIFLRSFALFLAVFAFSSIRLVAQDDTSVAEAARRARQQKQDATKPSHVIDNDSLPPAPVGAAAPSSAAPAPESNAPAPAAPGASADSGALKKGASENENQKKEIEALKQEIAEKKEKLNLVKREMALDQDSYLSNPDHDHDTAGKQKLDSMQSDIAEAQSELEQLQSKLAALAPPSDATAPETPPAPAAPEAPKP